MSTLSSVKLYGRVALLRRQVLFQQFIRRAIAAALAVAALVVAAGLATHALFLAITPSLGILGASLAIAVLYLVCALILLAYTLREPHSPEMQALEEAEAAALEVLAKDSQGMVQIANAAGHRIEDLGSNLALGIGLLSALRRLLASHKG